MDDAVKTTKEIPPGKALNKPSELGREMGKKIALICDDVELRRMLLRPRCGTCAFREGTIPNACEATIMDAVKCAAEGTPFMCHEHKNPKVQCAGWLAMKLHAPIEVTWPWSNSDEPIK